MGEEIMIAIPKSLLPDFIHLNQKSKNAFSHTFPHLLPLPISRRLFSLKLEIISDQ